MVHPTGCLGLSQHTTVLAAAIITLVESAVWAILGVVGNFVSTCWVPLNGDADISVRLLYMLYFYNPKCNDPSEYTPVGQSEPVKFDGRPSTATRTDVLDIVYIALSLFWLAFSLRLLVVARSKTIRPASYTYYPWILATSVVMLVDLVATGLYAADAAAFSDVEAVTKATGVTIPPAWFGTDTNVSFLLKTAPLLLMAVTTRGVVLWLLNGVLLVHVVRAARATPKEASRERRFQDPSRRSPPAVDATRVLDQPIVHPGSPKAAKQALPTYQAAAPAPLPSSAPSAPSTPSAPSAPSAPSIIPVTEHGHELVGAVPMPGLDALAQQRARSVSPPPARDPREPDLSRTQAAAVAPAPAPAPAPAVAPEAGWQSESQTSPRNQERRVERQESRPVMRDDLPERRIDRQDSRPVLRDDLPERRVARQESRPTMRDDLPERRVDRQDSRPVMRDDLPERRVDRQDSRPAMRDDQPERRVDRQDSRPVMRDHLPERRVDRQDSRPVMRDDLPERRIGRQESRTAVRDDLLERRADRQEGRHASRDEIVERLERMSQFRASFRKAELNPELAAEARVVQLRRHGSNASSVASESSYPRDAPRRGELSPTRKYHDDDVFPDDALGRPSRDQPRHLARMSSAEYPMYSRQGRDQDDPRSRRRVDRTQSHRVAGTEWTGQQPGGPAHGAYGRPGDLQELKKQLPWSYLTGNPAT